MLIRNYTLRFVTPATLRTDAARALRESYKFTGWPGHKDRKQEVKQCLTQLDGQP